MFEISFASISTQTNQKREFFIIYRGFEVERCNAKNIWKLASLRGLASEQKRKDAFRLQMQDIYW